MNPCPVLGILTWRVRWLLAWVWPFGSYTMMELIRKRLNRFRSTALLLIVCLFLVSVLLNKTILVQYRQRSHTIVLSSKSSPTSTMVETTQTPSATRHPLIPPYPYDYKFILNQPDKCKGEAPFLVLLIIVESKDNAARHAIRRTWGNESQIPGVSIVRLFLTGISPRSTDEIQKRLQEESMEFKDIIQQDFMDTYNNLTLKTLMGMEWVAKHCPNATYVMKIDSDMFMNVHYLTYNILKQEVRQNYISGYVVENTGPLRSKAYKWYVPKEVYAKDKYPPYCSGPGYAFSGDMARKIYDVAQTIQLINMEDSFIGICLQELKINITKTKRNAFNGHYIVYNRCRFYNLITVHHYSPKRLLEIWPDFYPRNDSGCPT